MRRRSRSDDLRQRPAAVSRLASVAAAASSIRPALTRSIRRSSGRNAVPGMTSVSWLRTRSRTTSDVARSVNGCRTQAKNPPIETASNPPGRAARASPSQRPALRDLGDPRPPPRPGPGQPGERGLLPDPWRADRDAVHQLENLAVQLRRGDDSTDPVAGDGEVLGERVQADQRRAPGRVGEQRVGRFPRPRAQCPGRTGRSRRGSGRCRGVARARRRRRSPRAGP